MILDVGPVGHGGICIAHAPDGRVVFIRHALPGERVAVDITEQRTSYLRADAVEVLSASAHRVRPPCPFAGPGRCGGCDWQHVSLDEQRRLKATVVTDQLRRLAGVETAVVVEPVPGDLDGLGWRTRMRLAVDADGVPGLRRHRSHDVEPIDECLIAHPDLPLAEVLGRRWPGRDDIDVVVTDVPRALGRAWEVPAASFWQVHVGAADLLAAAVVEAAAPEPGDRCLDLYAGVGLLAGALAPLVPEGSVTAVEANRAAAKAAVRNLGEHPNVEVVSSRVERWLQRSAPDADVVVLDPPRRGAGREVVDGIVRSRPGRVVYVACDPAALARDVALLGAAGYALSTLRAFDLFPMTAHVECVALLTSAG